MGNMKKFLAIGVLIFLTGCYQSSASLIGPAYTLGASGNIYQAGFSYGLNQTLEKTTGQTTLEHAKKFLKKSEKITIVSKDKFNEYKTTSQNKVEQIKIDSQEFVASVKSNIEKTRGNLLD